jgi:hypothetical protein
MDLKCRIIQVLANRCAFGNPVPITRLRLAIPVDNSRLDEVDEAIDELCTKEDFICESKNKIFLLTSSDEELIRYVRDNCESEVFRILRQRIQ